MLKVMIVDDSLIVRRILSTQLEKMGYDVVAQAKSGKEAIEFYETYMPDFVTMDITMPMMSGIDALKELNKLYNNVKVIMITSHGEERLVMDAIDNGAKAYILKPITEDKLVKSIKKIYPNA